MSENLSDLRCDLPDCRKRIVRTSMVISGLPFRLPDGRLVAPKWHVCRAHATEITRWREGQLTMCTSQRRSPLVDEAKEGR